MKLQDLKQSQKPLPAGKNIQLGYETESSYEAEGPAERPRSIARYTSHLSPLGIGVIAEPNGDYDGRIDGMPSLNSLDLRLGWGESRPGQGHTLAMVCQPLGVSIGCIPKQEEFASQLQ
ncbi:hypothetical protein SLEP1_g59147 [Rubroshorea leprosula]|uniref:Uncharacterized protein n=1 Tax=Rubroshorea leprosula TaxID=152421 RepID=A0AAV5MRJ8_9ROSI|nr:hypothetical protein SLEP1_g59147 [Rubroshorea leprosula]